MRFRVDVAKAYLAGCLALVWGLTACVSDLTLVHPPVDTGVELLTMPKGLAKGLMSTKILDANGNEVFSSTYNVNQYEASLETTMPAAFSVLDSLNLRAIGALLTGKGQGTAQHGSVSFAIGGKSYTIDVTTRGSKGEARDFKIRFGSGDTTLTITNPDPATIDRHFELKAGDQTLYSGASVVGVMQTGSSVEAPPDDESCLGRFAEISVDFGLAIAGVFHGLAVLDAFEILAGFIMLVNTIAQVYLWLVEQCYNTLLNWLRDFWIDNCFDPLFSWSPFCEE